MKKKIKTSFKYSLILIFVAFIFGSICWADQKNIEINDEGEPIYQEFKEQPFYDVNTKIIVTIKKTPYFFLKEKIIEGRAEPKAIIILKGPSVAKEEVKGARDVPIDFELTERGVKYRLKITRYLTQGDKNTRKNGAVIFNRIFQTYPKYNWGMFVGIYFPAEKQTEYEIGFNSPDADAKPSINRNKFYEAKAISFISWYPLGFEPDKKFKLKNILNAFHFNLGTELSSSFLKKLYFGIGLSVNYVSFDFFINYKRVANLRSGFTEGELMNENIDSVPLDYKPNYRYGLSVSFPINLATGFLGKIMGIK